MRCRWILVGLVFSSCTVAPRSSRSGNTIDWAVEGRATVETLKKLIQRDTINPPQPDSKKKNANETALLRWVQNELAREGVRSEIFESAPGRGNLIARYRGNGAKRPLLLMAHVDVVNVDPKMWSVDPLSGEEKDGFLWGRGALDDKDDAAIFLQVMKLLARARPSLEREVVLMLNADEESSAVYGAEWMVKNHWDKIDCEFVLNEGGKTTLKDGKIVLVGVQAAEKIYNDVRLWIRGESGHSSVPLPKNAIYDAARLLTKIEEFRFPIKLLPIQAAYFSGIADTVLGAEYRQAMKAVGSAEAVKTADAEGELCKKPRYNALLRTTVVPTIVRGGIRQNVLPPDVEINFNARLLPGEKLDEVIATLATHMGVKDYEVVEAEEETAIAEWKRKNETKSEKDRRSVAFFVTDRGLDAPASPFDTECFSAIRRVSAELAPGTVVVPIMGTGATDSRFFRAKGVTCYGIAPAPVSEEEEKSVHDHNERVRVPSVIFGVEWVYRTVLEIAR